MVPDDSLANHSPGAWPQRANEGDRLWTPWRMRYVAGGAKEDGCIFCNRLAGDDDVSALILHRGKRAFAIMNLFPYNTGHVMIVPNDHLTSPEDADDATTAEIAALRAPLLRALRRALSPDGFNLGLNIGSVAGAGVADHFHEHVVPRWQGDANFMPILAATTVMPEQIPVTYAKLRAEMAREVESACEIRMVLLSPGGSEVLLDKGGRLPGIPVDTDEPLWRTALTTAVELGVREPQIAGWIGRTHENSKVEAMIVRGIWERDSGLNSRFRPATADSIGDPLERQMARDAVLHNVP